VRKQERTHGCLEKPSAGIDRGGRGFWYRLKRENSGGESEGKKNRAQKYTFRVAYCFPDHISPSRNKMPRKKKKKQKIDVQRTKDRE